MGLMQKFYINYLDIMDYAVMEALEAIAELLKRIDEKLDKLVKEKGKTDELPF